MQGSVWGSLFCTATMDKLGQMAYENENLLYWYKGSVAVPPLCMVDDIMAVQECSQDSVQINSVINSFIDLKKLKLSHDKCSKIHVGKTSATCPELKVHSTKMKDSNQAKYLGDWLNTSGKVKQTIEERVSKGYGIVAEIIAMLDDIPLGQYRLEMGLKLRQAMLLNGVLFNSEAWHNISKEDIKPLEKVVETAPIPTHHILSSRRMMHLRTILKRDDEELVKRVFREQEKNTTPGDFYELIKNDFSEYNLTYNEDMITSSKDDDYKNMIRESIRKVAFTDLKSAQQSHSKVKEIIYAKYNHT